MATWFCYAAAHFILLIGVFEYSWLAWMIHVPTSSSKTLMICPTQLVSGGQVRQVHLAYDVIQHTTTLRQQHNSSVLQYVLLLYFTVVLMYSSRIMIRLLYAIFVLLSFSKNRFVLSLQRGTA